MRIRVVLAGLLLAGLASGRSAAQAPSCPPDPTTATCEDWRCCFQEQINACNCDGSSNHGRYVSCVAHKVKTLVDSGLPRNCKGKLVRCAARSTCGKPGFVTCQIPIDTCVIDETTGMGTCAKHPEMTCTTAAECGTKCKTKSSDVRCTDAGGTVGPSGSCCSACVTTLAP
jgi:hypothetical protein